MPRSRTAVLLLALLAPSLSALLVAPGAHAASSASVATIPDSFSSDSRGAVGLVGAGAAYVNGVDYILGGRFPNGEFSGNILKFDPSTGTTTKVASLPLGTGATDNGRYSGGVVSVGGVVYYFGGAVHVTVNVGTPANPQNAQIPEASADIIKFDPSTGTASIVGSLPSPAWGLGAAVTNVNGETLVYLFGGYNFQYPSTQNVGRLDQIVLFDPASQAITKSSATLPYALQDMGVAAIGNRFYLFGGVGDDNADYNPCPQANETSRYAFCSTNNILPVDALATSPEPEKMRHMPYSAQFVQASVIVSSDGTSRAYVPGGCLSDQTASSSVIVFQPNAATEVSTFPANLPEPVFGAGVVTDGSTVTLFGGRRDCSYDGYSNLTSSIVRVDPNPGAPYPPNGLAWGPLNPGVHLSWNAPTYDGGSPVTEYRVYRSSPTSNETLLGHATALTFDDTSAKAGGAYYYRVTAVNAIGQSATGARIAVNAETSVPGAVRNLQAYPLNGSALVRWSAPLDDGGAAIADYIVYDMTTPSTPIQIGTTDPRSFQFLVRGLANGQSYAYSVAAHNLKGDSALAKPALVTPEDVPEAPNAFAANVDLDAGKVTLSWTAGAGLTPDRFLVYRSTAAGDLGAAISTSVTDTTFTDATAERGHTYYYAVKAAHASLVSPPTDQAPVSLVHAPAAPTGVTAIAQQGSVRITWTPPTDTGDADPSALLYAVMRNKPGESPSYIGTDISGNNFVDTKASVGVTYEYRVVTLNPLQSAPSDPATASAKAVVNQIPIASLSLLPSVAAAGDPVQLDGSLSYDTDGVIRSYLFDPGDGTQPVRQTTPTFTHPYAANGTYTATLVVTDDRNDASKPVTERLVIGQPKTTEAPSSEGRPNPSGTATPTVDRPGSQTPKSPLPGPGVGLTLVAASLVALGLLRRRS